MPNWCENTLIITGPLNELKAFAAKAKPTPELTRGAYSDSLEFWQAVGETPQTFEEWFASHYTDRPLTFEAFAPRPVTDRDWKAWNIGHWGTKWDAEFGPLVSREGLEAAVDASLAEAGSSSCDRTLNYEFDTAWSPPLAAVEAMAEQHPALAFTLRYEEVGMGFAGEASFSDGVQVSDDEWSIEEELEPEEI